MLDFKLLKRQIKKMSNDDLKRLFELAELTEQEKWLVTYAYIQDLMVINICFKLHISEATYHRILNIALVKIYFTLKFVFKT